MPTTDILTPVILKTCMVTTISNSNIYRFLDLHVLSVLAPWLKYVKKRTMPHLNSIDPILHHFTHDCCRAKW